MRHLLAWATMSFTLGGAADGIVAARVPVEVPHSTQTTVTAVATRRAYRLFVHTPARPAPPGGYPVVFVLDGDQFFAPAVAVAHWQAERGGPAIAVVGIGFVEDGLPPRRFREFTPVTQAPSLPPPLRGFAGQLGGAASFRRFLVDEIVADVGRSLPLDRNCSALWGHSLGGLFVLETLFLEPGAFAIHGASSPSIQWNARGVLGQVDAFVQQRQEAGTKATLLLTASTDENPITAEVVALSQRLGREELEGHGPFALETALFPGETHASVAFSSLVRTLSLVTACGQRTPASHAAPGG